MLGRLVGQRRGTAADDRGFGVLHFASTRGAGGVVLCCVVGGYLLVDRRILRPLNDEEVAGLRSIGYDPGRYFAVTFKAETGGFNFR